MEKLKIVWTVKSECGPIRKKNEDSVFPDVSGSGFAPFKAGVFDGMGGHKRVKLPVRWHLLLCKKIVKI